MRLVDPRKNIYQPVVATPSNNSIPNVRLSVRNYSKPYAITQVPVGDNYSGAVRTSR